jgi:hypothetical protein
MVDAVGLHFVHRAIAPVTGIRPTGAPVALAGSGGARLGPIAAQSCGSSPGRRTTPFPRCQADAGPVRSADSRRPDPLPTRPGPAATSSAHCQHTRCWHDPGVGTCLRGGQAGLAPKGAGNVRTAQDPDHRSRVACPRGRGHRGGRGDRVRAGGLVRNDPRLLQQPGLQRLACARAPGRRHTLPHRLDGDRVEPDRPRRASRASGPAGPEGRHRGDRCYRASWSHGSGRTSGTDRALGALGARRITRATRASGAIRSSRAAGSAWSDSDYA